MNDFRDRLENWSRANQPNRRQGESNLMVVIRNGVNNPNFVVTDEIRPDGIRTQIDIEDAELIGRAYNQLSEGFYKSLIRSYWLRRVPFNVLAKRHGVRTREFAILLSDAEKNLQDRVENFEKSQHLVCNS